jgi:hypothetical protein
MFRAATTCAAVADQEGLTPGDCLAEFAQSTYPGSLDKTSLVVGFLDTSGATPECRAAIRRLWAQQENFSDITTRLEVALSDASPRRGLERARNLWFLVKGARTNALVQCR